LNISNLIKDFLSSFLKYLEAFMVVFNFSFETKKNKKNKHVQKDNDKDTKFFIVILNWIFLFSK
jgi:hypothetical protein